MFWSHFWQPLVRPVVAIFGNLLSESQQVAKMATSKLTKIGRNESQPVTKFGNFGPTPILTTFGYVRQFPIL